MITRRKDYSKKEPSKAASKIYIVCEGAVTEKKYFGFFEGLSSNLELIVIPPEEDKTDPIKLMALAESKFLSETCSYTLDYMQKDKVWFAIDTDTWEKEGKIQSLRDFCSRMNSLICKTYDEVKPYKAWNVAQSNPCFEVWLYYHHYDSTPDKDEVDSYSSVKEYVDSYIAGEFDYQTDPVRLKDAINNSEKNFSQQDNGNPNWFATEEFCLGMEIMHFVKERVECCI